MGIAYIYVWMCVYVFPTCGVSHLFNTPSESLRAYLMRNATAMCNASVCAVSLSHFPGK